MKKSIDDILEMIQSAANIKIIKFFKVKDGKFEPKIVKSDYNKEWVAIGYNAKRNSYLVLDKGGWTLSDKNTIDYFDEYNVDKQFKGDRVWVEKLSYGSDEE